MKQQRPPRLAEKLFNWYCGMAKADDLRGDLEELFYKNLKTVSASRAKLIYWKQVLSLLTSYAVRKRKKDSRFGQYASGSFSMAMFHNYVKVASRTLYRHKYFSLVNVIGLSIGMSVGLLLICLYVNVSTYDNFHANESNIYRINSTRQEGLSVYDMASAPAPLARKLQEEYTGIREIVRINSSFSGSVKSDKENIPLHGYYTDPNFLSVFTYEVLQGNKATALSKPNTLILTESAATKIFASTDCVGKVIEVEGIGSFEVTGVMKDHPINSHLEFEALVSYSSLPAQLTGDVATEHLWTNYQNRYIYLLLAPEPDLASIQRSLDTISKEVYGQLTDVKSSFFLQALTDITPGPELRNTPGPEWEYSGFVIFGTIALLILLPACFNYTNISIARALKRSKEIGLRKTMGGFKNQIFFQFITETVLVTLVSLAGAFLLFMVVRSEFQSMMVEASSLNLNLTWQMIVLFILFAIFTGLVAGLFPALHFSRLNPIQALKSQVTRRRFSKVSVRKVLIVFQFALSFCFIISLVVFSRQYRYSLNYDFGFQQENILNVELQDVNPERFRNEFSKHSSVQRISMSSDRLGLSFSNTFVKELDKADSTEVSQAFGDKDYLNNMKLTLIAGNNFPDEVWQREKYILVNEEFLKDHNLSNPVDAIGKSYLIDSTELQIIGVVKNFHFAPLNMPIKGFLLRMNPGHFRYANLNVIFTDVSASLSEMEKTWTTISDKKFESKFFDAEISDSYDFYKTLLKMVGFLGLLAISISLLGLLGMVVYTSETKTKEVGVRKVMGASIVSITILLSKDYLKLMLWAAAFAIPATTLIFDKFLSSMQYYHVTLSFWDVALSLLILLVMGLGTIASQTFKTASTNPAETLRTE